jgi:hypothetical protein
MLEEPIDAATKESLGQGNHCWQAGRAGRTSPAGERDQYSPGEGLGGTERDRR